MAKLMGKQGQLEMSSTGGTAVRVLGMDTWSLDISPDVIDVTEFNAGTVKSKSFEYGLVGVSGSGAGTLDMASTGEHEDLIDLVVGTLPTSTGTHVTFSCALTTAESLRGSCLITRIALGSRVQDKQTFACDFQVTGNTTHSG